MFYSITDNNRIIHINDYRLESENKGVYSPTFCPFCGKELFVRAKNSNEKTHFSHKRNQSCSFKSYTEFFNSAGHTKTSEEIEIFKECIIKNLYQIFLKLQSDFIYSLDTTLFLKILKKVSNPKILKLRNLNCNHIPYIWLNELGKFDNQVYLYTNSGKLDLNKLKYKIPYLWNITEKKDIIIIAQENKDNTISRTIIPIDLNFLDYNFEYSYKFLSEITSLKIFDIFSISSEKSELILKELLNVCK
ncbi:competence protein CoiA family protein [Clostridium nigeriense]|uniref:competence protein CoiA family protein n=1 Tax=Clostridium nigeriense TaxID=1805470 RepID=UPI00082E1C4F|nr:competence protein CoiA family protein [Clostridium nigeriense]